MWYEGTATSGYNTYPSEVLARVTVVNGVVRISVQNMQVNTTYSGTVTIPWQSNYATSIPYYPAAKVKPPKNWKWFDFLRTYKPYSYRKNISKCFVKVVSPTTCVSRAQKAAQKRKNFLQVLRRVE